MKRSLTAVLLCLLTAPLLAGTHAITKIDFRSRIPTTILRSQSLLSEDHTYSDEELDLAVARIRRLPFVYDARFRVEGSTLVVEVADEHHFFYGVDLLGETSNRLRDSYVDTGIGGRMYVRSGGVLEGGFGNLSGHDDNIGAANLQYSQYGIGGTPLFASLAVNRSLGGVFGKTDLQPTLTIGMPLSLSQTLSLVALRQGYHDEHEFALVPRPLRVEQFSETLELHYRYDTTNDPLFATRGRALEIVPSYGREKNLFESFVFRPSTGTTIFSEFSRLQDRAVTLHAENYWRAGERTSLIGGVAARARRAEGHVESNGIVRPSEHSDKLASASLLLAHNFFDAGSLTDTRHRIEGGVDYVIDHYAPGRMQRYYELELAYVFRNRWGTVRLTASHSTADIFHP